MLSHANIRSHTWGGHNMGLMFTNDSMGSYIPLFKCWRLFKKNKILRNQVSIFIIVFSFYHIVKYVLQIPIYGSPFILVSHVVFWQNWVPNNIDYLCNFLPFGSCCCLHLITWIYYVQTYLEFNTFWLY